jgi:UDP:flavonoid glycosyltransferase YjiC (YdhE family)
MKILFELMTGVGPLIRCLPIAKELKERGHDVHYFSRDKATKYMNAVGLKSTDFDPSQVAFKSYKNAFWTTTDEWMGGFGYTDIDWVESTQKAWQDFLVKFKPDLIVSDTGILSSIAARILRIPIVMLTQSCFHPGVKKGKLRFWSSEKEDEQSARDTVNQYFAKNNIDRIERFDDLFVGMKTLIPGIPEFEQFEAPYEKSVYFSGPILWDGFIGGNQNGEKARFDNNQKTIFCYTGRLNDSGGNSGEVIFNSIVQAFGRQDVNVLISTGGLDVVMPNLDSDMYKNIRLVDWIQMKDAYTSSDLIIHHGGHGSCMGNFVYGKPALVIPTHTEREYNAHLMDELKCGMIIKRKDVNAENVSEKANLLLKSHEYQENNLQLQSVIDRTYGNSVDRAVNYILS